MRPNENIKRTFFSKKTKKKQINHIRVPTQGYNYKKKKKIKNNYLSMG